MRLRKGPNFGLKMITFYVDNLINARRTVAEVKCLKRQLALHSEIKDCDKACVYIGLEFSMDRINQTPKSVEVATENGFREV